MTEVKLTTMRDVISSLQLCAAYLFVRSTIYIYIVNFKHDFSIFVLVYENENAKIVVIPNNHHLSSRELTYAGTGKGDFDRYREFLKRSF
jgi:hypothetical protein